MMTWNDPFVELRLPNLFNLDSLIEKMRQTTDGNLHKLFLPLSAILWFAGVGSQRRVDDTTAVVRVDRGKPPIDMEKYARDIKASA
jgi:hypothetical protein